MASTEGGVEIEEVAEKTPEKIVKEWVDPAVGLQPFQTRKIASALGLKGDLFNQACKLIAGVYRTSRTATAVRYVELSDEHCVMVMAEACERSREVTAVHVIVDPDEPSTVEEQWHRRFPAIPLVVIDSPFRTVSDPIALYVNDRLKSTPYEVQVMLPILQVKHWYQRPLVNQSLKRLVSLLHRQRHVEVVSFPFNPGDRAPKPTG